MTIEITIDGRKFKGKEDQTILDIADENGIHIPTLCKHPRLKANGACRICVVDVGRPDRLEAACTTPISPNMIVNTSNERVVRARKTVLELILSTFKVNLKEIDEKEINVIVDLSRELGVNLNVLKYKPKEPGVTRAVDARNPVIIRDRDRCILCGRCISACNEVRHYGVLNFEGRGYNTDIVSGISESLLEAGCATCGECVEVCPTGSIKTIARDRVQDEIDIVIETGAAYPISSGTHSTRTKLGLPSLDNSGVTDLPKIIKMTKFRSKPTSGVEEQ